MYKQYLRYSKTFRQGLARMSCRVTFCAYSLFLLTLCSSSAANQSVWEDLESRNWRDVEAYLKSGGDIYVSRPEFGFDRTLLELLLIEQNNDLAILVLEIDAASEKRYQSDYVNILKYAASYGALGAYLTMFDMSREWLIEDELTEILHYLSETQSEVGVNLGIVEHLLIEGASLLSSDGQSHNVLYAAIYAQNMDLAQYLIQRGADVLTTTRTGNTLLHAAAYKGEIDLIRELIRMNSSLVNQRNNSNQTPLFYASVSDSNRESSLTLLLNSGSDPCVEDINGESVSDFILSSSDEDLQRFKERMACQY